MRLEPYMKYQILEDIGKHIDRAAALVKSGHKFVYVLDNIDWEEKAHDMRQDVQSNCCKDNTNYTISTAKLLQDFLLHLGSLGGIEQFVRGNWSRSK